MYKLYLWFQLYVWPMIFATLFQFGHQQSEHVAAAQAKDRPDLVATGSVAEARAKGEARLEGKGYVMQDGNSSILTEADLIEPIHPGEILMEEFIDGSGLTQNKLAVSIGVPPRRINEIVHRKRGITADTAIRLARYFGTSEEFWMNLKTNYELRMERRALRDKVAAITPLKAA